MATPHGLTRALIVALAACRGAPAPRAPTVTAPSDARSEISIRSDEHGASDGTSTVKGTLDGEAVYFARVWGRFTPVGLEILLRSDPSPPTCGWLPPGELGSANAMERNDVLTAVVPPGPGASYFVGGRTPVRVEHLGQTAKKAGGRKANGTIVLDELAREAPFRAHGTIQVDDGGLKVRGAFSFVACQGEEWTRFDHPPPERIQSTPLAGTVDDHPFEARSVLWYIGEGTLNAYDVEVDCVSGRRTTPKLLAFTGLAEPSPAFSTVVPLRLSSMGSTDWQGFALLNSIHQPTMAFGVMFAEAFRDGDGGWTVERVEGAFHVHFCY